MVSDHRVGIKIFNIPSIPYVGGYFLRSLHRGNCYSHPIEGGQKGCQESRGIAAIFYPPVIGYQLYSARALILDIYAIVRFRVICWDLLRHVGVGGWKCGRGER